MQAIKWAVIYTVIFSSVSALANHERVFLDRDELYDECSEFSQAGMRECLREKAKESQQVLEQVEEEIFFEIPRKRVEPEYIFESVGKLPVANQAFYLYRDACCAFRASLSGGGNGRSIAHPLCIAAQNNRRAAQLDKIIDNLKTMAEVNLAIPSTLLFENRPLHKKCGWKGGDGGAAEKCLDIETEKSFQALKQAEVEIFSTVTEHWDEEFNYIIESKGKLALSSQQFYLYRDAHCAFEASLTIGEDYTRGTLHSICIAELNHWQASQLHKIAILFKSNPEEDK